MKADSSVLQGLSGKLWGGHPWSSPAPSMQGALQLWLHLRSMRQQLTLQAAAARTRTCFTAVSVGVSARSTHLGRSREVSPAVLSLGGVQHSVPLRLPRPSWPARDITAAGRPRKASTASPLSDDPAAAPSEMAAAASGAEADAPPKAVRKRRTRKAAPVTEPASPVVSAAEPPAVLDLNAGAPSGEAAAAWAAVERWVVFSDLHVSPKTLAVGLEVLRAVHAEAVKRDAGILFLGEPTNWRLLLLW